MNRPLLVCTTGMIRAHIAARADSYHRGFKVSVDLRIFVFELDLPAALLDAGVRGAFAVLHAPKTESPTAPAQGQITRRFGAGIQMLMEPLIRRHNNAAGFPIDALHRLPFRPQNRVALPREDNDVRTRTVPVPFLVGSDGKLRDVRAHGIFS